MKTLARLVLPVTAFLLLASAPPALAQFPWAGARAMGMGGAQVGAVNDSSAIWSDPAALGSLKGWDIQILGSISAQNRNDLVGTLSDLANLPFDDIGNHPEIVPKVIAGVAKLAQPGTAVVSSGVFGLVASYNGFGLSIDVLPYAGIYPIVDLDHLVPGGGPDNGLAYNNTGLYLAGLSAREARLAYGHAFLGGALEVGGSLRFVSGVTYFGRCTVFNDECQGQTLSGIVHEVFNQNARTSFNVTFDAAARANFGIVKIGVVGTSLTQPTFAVADVPGSPGSLPLPRQVRGGASVDVLPILTIAADGDLIKSDTLAPGVQSQELSLGAEFRIPMFAFRAGATRDFAAANPTWAYSLGLGFGIPTVSVDAAILFGPTGGLNYSNPNREALGGSAGVRVHF